MLFRAQAREVRLVCAQQGQCTQKTAEAALPAEDTVDSSRGRSAFLTLKLVVQEFDDLLHLVVVAHAVFHQTVCVEDGAVVAATEGVADFAERHFGQFAGEEHGDLAREGDAVWASFAGHVGETNVEVFCHAFLDLLHADGAARFFLQEIFEQNLDAFLRRLGAAERTE